MARSQNNERNADYSHPSVEEVLSQQREQVFSQQRARVASRRRRVNPAERPPGPPKRTSKSDDDKRR